MMREYIVESLNTLLHHTRWRLWHDLQDHLDYDYDKLCLCYSGDG